MKVPLSLPVTMLYLFCVHAPPLYADSLLDDIWFYYDDSAYVRFEILDDASGFQIVDFVTDDGISYYLVSTHRGQLQLEREAEDSFAGTIMFAEYLLGDMDLDGEWIQDPREQEIRITLVEDGGIRIRLKSADGQWYSPGVSDIAAFFGTDVFYREEQEY